MYNLNDKHLLFKVYKKSEVNSKADQKKVNNVETGS